MTAKKNATEEEKQAEYERRAWKRKAKQIQEVLGLKYTEALRNAKARYTFDGRNFHLKPDA